jgi:predicted Zn finger-like uncharacterized protein
MNAEQYTRCPHCKSTFEVTPSQLSAAGGKVRCGACMEVFDALAYLINGNLEDDTNIPTEASTSSNPDSANQTNSKARPVEQETEEDDDFVFEDSEEDRKEAQKSMFDESQLSDSLRAIDTSKKHAFSSDSNDDDDEDQEDDEKEDEDWANQILEDKDEPVTVKASPEDRPVQAASFSPTPSKQEKKENSKPETIDFYYEETETVRARGIFSKIIITLGCIALLLVLIAQAAWFHYEKLVQYPLAKKGFEMACEQIGCSLPELADLNAIKSSNLVVRSHPITPNSLIIDVVLTNEASFDQDYPRLALYFSDINGQTVAQQIIAPEQYLNDKTLEMALMPRDKPIHVSLEIEDPGKRAVNYKIRFFPNKSEKKQ